MARSTVHAPALAPIDCVALVRRHDPVLRQRSSVVAVVGRKRRIRVHRRRHGVADFPEVYEQATPPARCRNGDGIARRCRRDSIRRAAPGSVRHYGRQVGYTVSAEGQNELYNWLRENPHRLHLGRVALRLTKSDGGEAQVADITDIEQRLDLWAGALTSRFKFEGSR